MNSQTPVLLPTPRHITRLDGTLQVQGRIGVRGFSPPAADLESLSGGVLAAADGLGRSDQTIACFLDATSPPSPEGYRLLVKAGGMTASARDEKGLANALRTAVQLIRWARARNRSVVPALAIEDWPEFRTRGVMLDISRCKVPTMASLRAYVDSLAGLKYNHLQLYTEHTFAYEGHEEVWRSASPIMRDEARELDAYARSRGIELVANQNCFGHLSNWLRCDRYAHLAETHGAWRFADFSGERHGPFSLCPIDPRSLELVEDLLDQLLPAFSSHLVNIGCDETFDIGYGRSADEVRARGFAAVYLGFVRNIADAVRARGRRPMLWADIALNHPEELGRFPDGAIGLAWGYEPDSPFDAWGRALHERGIEWWACPGSSSWRAMTGRTRERRKNLAAAARAGEAHGATGFLVCDWGDNGHHQQWPICLHALGHGAEAAWGGASAAEGFEATASSLHALNDHGGDAFGPWLEALGGIDESIRRCGWRAKDGSPAPVRNATALFVDLYRPEHTPPVQATVGDWEVTDAALSRIELSCPGLENPLAESEVRHTLEMARLAVDHALLRRRGGEGAVHRSGLPARLNELIRTHESNWLARNRPGGLVESTQFLRRISDRWMQDPTGSTDRL